MAIFRGAGVALVTPFDDDLKVNFDKLDELIEFQIANGTDSIIITGTTGEGSTLSMEEHAECIKFAVDRVKHRIPVIAGTGSNCTEEAVYLSKKADECGVDGLLVVTPYYNKATQNGLKKYFTEIADAVKAPLVLYNVPSRTGVNILPETAASLIKGVPNIVGMKDAAGNISQSLRMMSLVDGEMELYSGNDDQIIPLLSIGGIGVISVLSNVAPRETHDIVMEYLEGDQKKALELQRKALPLCDALFCEVNPIPVKMALNMMGKQVGSLRGPLCDMEEEHQPKLKKALLEFGLIENA